MLQKLQLENYLFDQIQILMTDPSVQIIKDPIYVTEFKSKFLSESHIFPLQNTPVRIFSWHTHFAFNFCPLVSILFF